MTDYDSIWRTQDGSQGSGTVLHISDVRSSHNMMFILLIWEECYKTHFISCAAPIFCVPLHLEKIRIFIHRFIIYFYFVRCEVRELILVRCSSFCRVWRVFFCFYGCIQIFFVSLHVHYYIIRNMRPAIPYSMDELLEFSELQESQENDDEPVLDGQGN